MIVLDNVYKRYLTDHVPGEWVLQGVSLTIPHKACVGVVGARSSGKSTLLRLIAGTEEPTSGTVERNARTVTPATFRRTIQPLLSGRQNAKFICRVNGNVDDLEERLAEVERLASLGNKFDKPASTYTQPMKASLGFALTMALDFDMYVADDFIFSGPTAFRSEEAAESALKQLTQRAGIFMTSQKASGEGMLRQFCKSGIWVHEGKADWFDDIEDAIEAHKASQPPAAPRRKAGRLAPVVEEHAVSEQTQSILNRIKLLNGSLKILKAGLSGAPESIPARDGARLLQAATQIGMTLLPPDEIAERGYRVREGETPVLKRRIAGTKKDEELYDLETQCEKQELTT